MSKVEKKRLLIFASGFQDPSDRGGKGAVRLAQQAGEFGAEVIGIVTDYRHGSVAARAEEHDIRCFAFPRSGTATLYRRTYNELIHAHRPDLTVFCGWRKPVFQCLCPSSTINVRRGLLVGDQAVSYYKAAEKAVLKWLRKGDGKLTTSLTINFVRGERVDDGPTIIAFNIPVDVAGRLADITSHDIIEMVREKLRETRRHYLPQVVEHVLLGLVSWDGVSSYVVVPSSYRIKADPNEGLHDKM